MNNLAATPNFLLKLHGDDELTFTFTFVIRQSQLPAATDGKPAVVDTNISGLTFVCASTPREVSNLVTREFHADPNLHKNANVDLVGDYNTAGTPSLTFEWTWKWKPPKPVEDKGGGWRNCCSVRIRCHLSDHNLSVAQLIFYPRTVACRIRPPGSPLRYFGELLLFRIEYVLVCTVGTLTAARYTVLMLLSGPSLPLSYPSSPSPQFLLSSPPKIRVASTQSVESRLTGVDVDEPGSPVLAPNEAFSQTNINQLQEPVKVDVPCPRYDDDSTVSDDGPVFRATLKALEQKTGNMRSQMKKVLKRAENAHLQQSEANDAFVSFMEALREASSTNANAFQPALEHYFDKIAREVVAYECQNTANLQKIIIEPLNKLYQLDIKQAEYKKRDFEEESKDYYAYVSRYLGQRQDSVKAKKLADSDSKYQNKRRNFELKRFDYSNFVQDLHGGRKEQEVLSHLTKYADAQTKVYLATAKRIEDFLPELSALSSEVQEADKEYQYRRREREEKRRQLEKSNTPYLEPEQASLGSSAPLTSSSNGNAGNTSDSELGRADSTGSQFKNAIAIGVGGQGTASQGAELSRSPGSQGQSSMSNSLQGTKFKGFRDLEERDAAQTAVSQRKEGLLWALNRPGGHVDPRNLNKQGWHK